MNVAITPENVTAGQMLAGKLSLVTGSTSGIGLAVAGARRRRFRHRPQRVRQAR